MWIMRGVQHLNQSQGENYVEQAWVHRNAFWFWSNNVCNEQVIVSLEYVKLGAKAPFFMWYNFFLDLVNCEKRYGNKLRGIRKNRS